MRASARQSEQMVINIDSGLISNYYLSRFSAAGAGGGLPQKKVAPTAPWNQPQTPEAATAAVKSALQGSKFINENAAKLDLPGASGDYRKLFALFQGLMTLNAVAERTRLKGLTSFEKARIDTAFTKGMAEITSYISTANLEKVRLAQGEATNLVKTTVPVARAKTEYVTKPLHSGTNTGAVAAFQGNVQFQVAVTDLSGTTNVAIDLAGMGATTRSMSEVVIYINQQLEAAGVGARFANQRIPGVAKTTVVGGQTITLAPAIDQWALKVKPGSAETVSFSTAATAGAVYMAQTVGNPDPDGKPLTKDGVLQRQFVKFQTDAALVDAPLQPPGEANWVDGRIFAQTLPPQITAVRETKVAADGSVYMLADVVAKTSGQDIKGAQDVALLKYDAAGTLIFSRTLGAAETATGLALAVAADGKIAVAGAVTGALEGAVNGPSNSTDASNLADSFVTVFDAQGQELWTQRRGASQADEATGVAFGADGTVYVTGRAQSSMPGTTAIGGWDNYLQAFKADVAGVPQTLFTQSIGTAGDDKPAGLVVDGTSVVTASVEGGRAVLRRFDVSGPAPVLSATQDLGDLQGGAIAGLALDGTDIVLAGTTSNAGLSAGTITRAHAGGTDAFVAHLSASLAGGPGDAVAYYGGTGDDKATSLAVTAGQVWIAGSVGADLPGQPAVGTKDGFLTRLDVGAGTIDWSRRFTGKDGHAAPTAIAVAPTGASALDRLGLPSGALQLTDSQRITAVSAIRGGDQFTVKVGSGRAVTVSIAETDTLDTLAQKIRRATGFNAKVTLSTVEGMRKLTVAPLNDRSIITFGPGTADADALEMLGIPEGVVRAVDTVKGKAVAADGKPTIYGLSLPSDLNLSNEAQVSHVLSELAQSMGVIRKIYKDLVAAATPWSAAKAMAENPGKAPEYLTNQIANYQAALDRLTGGR
jgi:hypothetical protein